MYATASMTSPLVSVGLAAGDSHLQYSYHSLQYVQPVCTGSTGQSIATLAHSEPSPLQFLTPSIAVLTQASNPSMQTG